MKRHSFVIRYMRAALIVVFSLIISACSFQKNVNVKSIEIVEETIPEFIIVGEFDEAGIKALITYEDDTTEKIDVNSNLLADAYQEYINQVGEYEIEILFKGVSTTFNIRIIDMEEVHIVKFFNGFNELVSMQLVEDGKDAMEPLGQAHQIQGYKFIGWDRIFTNVTEDINVYAIYTKIGETENETINYHQILMNAVDNMRSGTLNILDVWELSSKRIETTNHYLDFNLDKVVKKVIESNREVSYNKYFKRDNINETISYVYEKYDSNGFYSIVDITADEFSQYDIYAYVKKIVSSTDDLTYSTIHTTNEKFYKLVAVVPNNGDGGHDSDTYEFLFNTNQLISLKHWLNYKTNIGTVDNTLVGTQYYTLNPTDDEKIVFPSDIKLDEITTAVYSNDVVVTVEEMRDYLVVTEQIKNDAASKVSLIIRDEVETYKWDKEEYTFYTKEEINSNVSVQVYKTIDSIQRYGFTYYYKWKEISGNTSSIRVNNNQSVSLIFEIEETSSNQGHYVEFVVLKNKLIEYKKYSYNNDILNYIEKTTFKYEDLDIDVPTILIEGESTAVVE